VNLFVYFELIPKSLMKSMVFGISLVYLWVRFLHGALFVKYQHIFFILIVEYH